EEAGAGAGAGVGGGGGGWGGGAGAPRHERSQARRHRPPPMAAGRPRGRDELAALLPDLPRRLTEQELGAQLESDPQRPGALGPELTLAAIEPARLPAVALV